MYLKEAENGITPIRKKEKKDNILPKVILEEDEYAGYDF